MKIDRKQIFTVFLFWMAASLFYMHQYAQRLMLGSLSHNLINEFNIQYTDIAHLVSLFVYSYLFSTLLSGWLIKHFLKKV